MQARTVDLPFDWTLTTAYAGTVACTPRLPVVGDLSSPEYNAAAQEQLGAPLVDRVLPSSEAPSQLPPFTVAAPDQGLIQPGGPGIDYDVVADRAVPIQAYDSVTLYESELDDNGASRYTVKVRAMPTCVYILARFYLRVDGVLVRAWETRAYCPLSPSPDAQPSIAVEWQEKEAPWPDLVPPGVSGPALAAMRDEEAVVRRLPAPAVKHVAHITTLPTPVV